MRRMRASVVGLVVAAIAFACDSSPTAPPTAPPTLLNRAALTGLTPHLTASSKSTGLISCSQTYDSVTQVIGPLGGLIAVGHHFLWVDSLALGGAVSITAVAPAGTVRWVRFQPDGLVFQTNTRTAYPAVIYTDYTGCSVPTTTSAWIVTRRRSGRSAGSSVPSRSTTSAPPEIPPHRSSASPLPIRRGCPASATSPRATRCWSRRRSTQPTSRSRSSRQGCCSAILPSSKSGTAAPVET